MKPDATQRQVDSFIARYTPEMAAAINACRARLRERVPRGYELVYDNYNALAIGYAWDDKASASLVSIAGYPRWVTLFFLYGKGLPDPGGLLQGEGARVRSMRLASPDDLDKPAVQRLLDLALAPHAADFAAAPPLKTIVKAVSAKQRERRPA